MPCPSARLCPRVWVLVVMVIFAMGAGAWVGEAHAQPPLPPAPRGALEGKWTVGLAAGLWGRPEPPDDAKRSSAFDISIQRSLGRKWPATSETAIRLQFGGGGRYSSGDADFHYRRVMVGAIREFHIIASGRPPFYAHLAAGVGAYRVSSAGKRETKSSLFAEAGFDVRLGSSPLTLGPELQLHTIGDLLYGTTSIVARIRLP